MNNYFEIPGIGFFDSKTREFVGKQKPAAAKSEPSARRTRYSSGAKGPVIFKPETEKRTRYSSGNPGGVIDLPEGEDRSAGSGNRRGSGVKGRNPGIGIPIGQPIKGRSGAATKAKTKIKETAKPEPRGVGASALPSLPASYAAEESALFDARTGAGTDTSSTRELKPVTDQDEAMRIWAQTHGDLAKKVVTRVQTVREKDPTYTQSGYKAILGVVEPNSLELTQNQFDSQLLSDISPLSTKPEGQSVSFDEAKATDFPVSDNMKPISDPQSFLTNYMGNISVKSPVEAPNMLPTPGGLMTENLSSDYNEASLQAGGKDPIDLEEMRRKSIPAI